ncbi:hypothetical protein OHA25_07765 [Nonomuraea sp. NBC_00507]|uniref:hypothetical protein n=1 Tax=Nonomuraea sp. NBC_00507 TaxID=2976002 RepID=UPI002E17B40B
MVGSTVVASAPLPAAAAGRVPAQFIAKMYSEALGRMPDAGGWAAMVADFSAHGCSTERIRERVRAFYTSSEFVQLPYDAQSRVLTLYRGALNREPDQNGFDHHVGLLMTDKRNWSQTVESFAAGDELGSVAKTICGSATYHYGTVPAPTLTAVGTGFAGGTGQALQSLLDAAPDNSTVYLAQKAVVRLQETLVIPPGRTLVTTGAPPVHQYARQARLVRAGSFSAPMVRVQGGGRLLNVWVDGQRGAPTNYVGKATNVQVMGGNGTQVSRSKISNSLGWTSLEAFGSYENFPCQSTMISDNLVTAYSSDHYGGRLTDGLSVACENATIEGNRIIDATDVGIVVYRSSPAVQRSSIRANMVLNAGNSAYGAIAFDGLHSQNTTHDFTGASMSANSFWTGPDAHVEIGLVVGSRSWFGVLSDAGTGAAVRDNSTNGLTAVVGTGIAVTGMHRGTVQGNDLRLSVEPIGRCPHVNFGVDADGHADDGDYQPGWTKVSFTDSQGRGCLTAH